MRPLRRLVPLVPLVALGALLVPAPALAASYVHVDPTGDGVMAKGSGADKPDPSFKASDITKLGVIYAGKELRITTTLRALATRDWTEFAEIHTPQTTRYDFFVIDNFDHQGHQTLSLMFSSGHIGCAGLAATLSRTRHTLTFHVPTHCIGAPASLRLGVGVVVTTTAGKVHTYHSDDAQKKGDFKRLALSPVIKHN